jgi:hypothetical protein
MALNSADRWHTRRTKAGQPAGRYDLQSVAAHEFGHGTGFMRHFNVALDDDEDGVDEWSAQRARCGDVNPKRETMCGAGDTGYAHERDLGPHDKHTFRNVYP